MLNLFKSQRQLITEIHSDFDFAQERLLNEAREIINHVKDKKGERLAKLGFTQTNDAVKYLQDCKTLDEKRELAKLIEYYKSRYPFQKFITVQELDRICTKYKLIYAPVGRYKESVPEKNLLEIENAPDLDEKDVPQNTILWKYSCRFGGRGDLTRQEARVLSKFNEIKKQFLSNSENASQILGRDVTTGYQGLNSQTIEINRQGLFIAAPKSHFNLKGLQKHGMLHAGFTLIAPKDPIVFRFVKGGVQIITKWGLEANDPELVNEKLN